MGANEKRAATYHPDLGPDEITADVYRFEARSLQAALDRVLDALPPCPSCGRPFRGEACGPFHALIATDPASHRIFKERDEAQEALASVKALADEWVRLDPSGHVRSGYLFGRQLIAAMDMS